MPAKSQAQQRFFGMVDAYQKGELPKSKASKAIRRAADDMTRKEVKKFASTKHKGLPEKVDEETMEQKPVKESVRINRDQLRNIVAEAVRKCINEEFDIEEPCVYTVWVGGVEVNDELLTKEEAKSLANRYIDEGYDDVKVAKY